MDGQLFDIPEPHKNKYIEPERMTPSERKKRIEQSQPLHYMAGDNQKDTSWQAALDARPRMKGIKKEIMELLELRPDGLTCSEFCLLTGREKPSCSPRFVELEAKGLVVADGVRETNTGSRGTVYKLAFTRQV